MLLMALGMIFSCQRVELPEEEVTESSDSKVFGEATIRFGTLLPSSPQTKALGDAPFVEGDQPDDIKSLYLVIFDANGMLVESRPAHILSQQTHDGHPYESEYEVTLTMSDQPRIIHFIANCPVDQIVYGHETSIIGNMYVEKDKDPGTPETAYWARITVDDLIIEDAHTDNPHFANEDVDAAFSCVPLLRNFSQISVLHDDKNISTPANVKFTYLGFTVYNTVDMGTVAPYNKLLPYDFATGKFQSFLETPTKTYSYPDFLNLRYPYEGHALAAADLNTDIEKDPVSDDGYKWYNDDNPYYMYERKISVKTDIDSLWNESPPHLIIKGMWQEGDDKPAEVCYYKVDLVYKIKGSNDEDREIKYYNILRNFKYQFTITSVEHKGYSTVLEAVNGATSNNLAGSSTTSNFTNISDNEGRLWVSYTDKMLVTGDRITFYYRYEPVLGSGKYENNLISKGGHISFEDPDGGQIAGANVIERFAVADEDEEDGEWAGYRRVDIDINEPDDNGDVKEQSFVLRTDKATLSREIRHTLREKYTMEVECTPAVLANIGEELKLDIRLPGGLTANMFPLVLRIEVENTSLSPDASKNTIPVEVGKSTIPGKVGQPTFYYVKTIETKDDYDNLTADGTSKVVTTHWITNIANSASKIYVSNEYFVDGIDNFLNGVIFTDVKVIPGDSIFYGVGETADITFTMSDDDNNYQNKEVTVQLNGLADANGNTELKVKPSSGNRTVRINGLLTTSLDGNVSFTVSHADYISVTSSPVQRQQGVFTDLKVGNNPAGGAIFKGKDQKTSLSFKLDSKDVNPTNRQITVQLFGLINGEDGLSSVTFTPTGPNVLIDNLYTTTDDGNIRVIVTETNGVYDEYIANFTRRDRQFQNVRIEEASVGASAGQNVTFKFTIPDEEYTEDMVVNVDMVNLVAASTGQPGEKDKLVVATKANNSYTYTPSRAGEHTLNLKTTENAAGECSVTISASGFSDASAEVEQSAATHALKASNKNSNANNNVYDCQAVYQMSSLTQGGSYKLVFYAKADQQIDRNNFGIYLKTTDGDGQQRQLDNLGPVTTEWQRWEIDLNQNQNSINYGNYNMLAFNIGKVVPGNAIYFDKVSLVEVRSGREFIINGDFEESTGADFLSSEENKYDGNKGPAPTNTWWVKMNTNANPKPDCTLELVENGYEGTTP